jgi:hypothetical protein
MDMFSLSREGNITIYFPTSTFYMETPNNDNEECVRPPPRPLPPRGMKPPQPPRARPQEPLPPPFIPPTSFFANIHDYKKKAAKEMMKAKSRSLLPLKLKSKQPAVFVGPAARPPAPYVSPQAVLKKMQRKKVPAKYHSPLVQKVYGMIDDDEDVEVRAPMPPRSMPPMAPMPAKKVSKKVEKKPMGPTMKKSRAPKTFPSTSLMYVSDGDDEIVYTAIENEDGGIIINGSRVGKKKKN